MKILKFNIRLVCTILIVTILSCLFISRFNVEVVAEKNSNTVNNNDYQRLAQIVSGDPSMTAKLYTDPECTQLDQELLTSGVELTDTWLANTSRYLKVELENLSASNTYKVLIDLDQHLYANIKSIPTDDTFSEIIFTKNSPFAVNVGQTYELEEFSGAFEYVTKKGYTSLSIVLEIRYDNVLWNKFNNMNITADDGDLLNVIFMDESENKIDSKTLTKFKASGNLDYDFRVSMNIDTDTSNNVTSGVIYASSTNTVRFKVYSATMDSPIIGCYYEQFLVEMEIPKANGYVMEFDESTFKTNGNLKFELTHNTDDNKLIILFYDLYITSKQIFEVTFSFPSDMLTSTGIFEYKGQSKIILPGGSNTGTDYAIRTDNYKIVMENKLLPKLSNLYSNGVVDPRNKNAVQYIGGYGLVNKGATSGPLTYFMTFNDKTEGGARVNLTTFRLNPDNLSQYLKITYTMEDEMGNPIWFDSSGNVVTKETEGATREAVYSLFNPHYGKTLVKSSSILFHRGMLIESHRKYYFSSIKYTIQSMLENSQLWQNSAVKSYTGSTGSFWGYVVGDKGKISHNVIVYDEKGVIIPDLTREITTTIKIVEQVPFGLKNPVVSKDIITAGESLKISGEAFVVDYPYSANNVLNIEGYNMRIGISLPKGASINTDSIEIRMKDNSLLDIVNVTSEEQSDGSVFWIIEIKAVDGDEIGYVSEKLGALDNGNSIRFSFEINTERSTAGTNINLRENLFFAAYNITNAAGGSYDKNAGVDKYDLNGNGRTSDNVGILSTAEVSFQITALSAKLSINDSLRTSDNSQVGNEIILTDYNDSIIYDLSIVCESGGTADDFIYFIPIINDNNSTGEIIKDNNVLLVLNDEVSVYNSIVGNGVKIYYTNVSNLDYNDAYTSSADIWFTELPTGVTWSDITMIKVVSFDEFISNGSESIVSLKLNYSKSEAEFISEAGMKSIWCSRGYYNYSFGNRTISGHFSTDNNTVVLNYTMPTQEITLTAAKDRIPSESAALIKDTIKNIPVFKNTQSYKITDIVTHNITLKSTNYLIENANIMNSEESNRTFGFEIAINSNSPVDINQTLPLSVGTAFGNFNTTISLEIYNGDIFSDNTTIRYIKLTLKSDNGVTIPILVYVERELTEILASEIGITSGKEYRPFSSSLTSVVVGSDSSLTAQFVGELLPDNYKGRNLTFEKPLGVGTTIVMSDWTNSSFIEYYYYIVTNEINTIDLTEFKKMGTNSDYYQNPTGSTLINENLLFIIDFEKADKVFENSITLNRVLKNDTVNESKLDFETINHREFDLVVYNSNAILGEDISLAYEVHDVNANDSKYNGHKMTLVISASQNSSIPADAYIILDSMRYYANGNGEFIIPLGDTQISGHYELNFTLNSKTISSNYEDVELNVSLWSSTNNLKPFGGFKLTVDKVIKVSAINETAFNVTNITNRFLTKEDLKNPITLSYDANGLSRLTLEMHQKISEGYTLISTGINAVNNDTTHYGGVFELSVSNERIAIKFNEMLEEGSYKLVFRLYDELKQETKNVSFSIIISK